MSERHELRASVEKLAPEAFSDVLPLLRAHDPQAPDEAWRNLLAPPWERPEDYCGYGLVAEGRVVGFCGYLFSERLLGGRRERFCNVTTWVVEERYRGQSLSLFLPALKLEDTTVTDLSPSPHVALWCARWLRPLERSVTVLAPVGPGARLRRGGVRVHTDGAELETLLAGERLQLLRDHRALPGCGALLAAGPDGDCFVLYSRVARGARRPYAHLHHVDRPAFLARHSLVLREAVARQADVSFVVVDSRLLGPGRPPLSYELPLEPQRYYRSERLSPAQVDTAYSELPVLAFGTIDGPLPGGRECVRRLARRVVRRRGSSDGSDPRDGMPKQSP
jgi:GNAT superfamily N-acetyltransferase